LKTLLEVRWTYSHIYPTKFPPSPLYIGRRRRNKSITNIYTIAPESIPSSTPQNSIYTFQLLPSIAYRQNHPPLKLEVTGLETGAWRVRIEEGDNKVEKRWER